VSGALCVNAPSASEWAGGFLAGAPRRLLVRRRLALPVRVPAPFRTGTALRPYWVSDCSGAAVGERSRVVTLQTDRLILRMLRDSDIDAYAEMCGDPETMRHVGDGPPL